MERMSKEQAEAIRNVRCFSVVAQPPEPEPPKPPMPWWGYAMIPLVPFKAAWNVAVMAAILVALLAVWATCSAFGWTPPLWAQRTRD